MKHPKSSLVFLAVLVAVVATVGLKARHYYGVAAERPVYPCQHHRDDTLRLAIVGDSWAFCHRDHDGSLARLLGERTHRPVKVGTYGLCGATSKEVYVSMFEDDGLRRLLQAGADYCFISVGINDTYKKMGARYYAHHTVLILRFLLENGITPILLEIPDYDISYAYERQTPDRKLLRRLSMLVTGNPLDCRESYRQALRQVIEERRIVGPLIIPNQHWDMSLYQSDRMHLGCRGYEVLDSCICKFIGNNVSLP